MRRLLAAALMAAVTVVVASCGDGSFAQHGARRADPETVDRALAFADEATRVSSAKSAPWFGGSVLVRWVRRRSAVLPLPSGGNLNGIEWNQVRTGLSVVDVDRVLSHNARCQWLRALRDGRDAPTAAAVLAIMRSKWPAFDTAGTSEDRFDSVAVADCDRSWLRQQRYAAAKGLPLPR